MNKRMKLVINPVAGQAKAKKDWSGLRRRLEASLGEFSWEFTEQENHATALTQNALRAGYETIVAVGGDGTISEVVNGFYENGKPINKNAKLGIVPMGTGGDLVRTLGIPKTVELAGLLIMQGKTIQSDLGLLKCRRLSGGEICRYFVNVSDAGFGGTLINLSNHSTKIFGAFFAYLIA
ncbi:MAG: diacylglycerol/lipid kinase family protein, partial [bacterium]